VRVFNSAERSAPDNPERQQAWLALFFSLRAFVKSTRIELIQKTCSIITTIHGSSAMKLHYQFLLLYKTFFEEFDLKFTTR
jgi:hypothetical protein